MRSIQQTSFRACAAMLFATSLCAQGGSAIAATPAPPAFYPGQGGTPGPPVVIPAVGSTVRYRLTRTVQADSGPQTFVSDVTLRRKAATALTIQGVYGESPDELTVLNVAPDGTLSIPKNDSSDSQNPTLVDVVAGLNQFNALVANSNGSPKNGWTAQLALPDVRGVSQSILVPVEVTSAGSADFDLHGAGQLLVQAQNNNGAGGGHRGGFHGGGGFPGGGGGGRGGPGGGAGGDGGGGESGGNGAPPMPQGRPGFAVAVSVDGRIRHGSVNKLAIVETRSISIDAVPYVNVSGWTLDAAK
jgi:hypothetical protein